MRETGLALYPSLSDYVSDLWLVPESITSERTSALQRLADFIGRRNGAGEAALLVFICTHNSRRSQLAQVWAETAARLHGAPGVRAFSGGTEATAVEPRAVAALERAGFSAERLDDSDNPVYRIRSGDDGEPVDCFSKVFDRPPNPTTGFAAVMTCSAADMACPVVAGAAERIALPFDDPGALDDTDREIEAYDACCRRIARDMLFALSLVPT